METLKIANLLPRQGHPQALQRAVKRVLERFTRELPTEFL